MLSSDQDLVRDRRAGHARGRPVLPRQHDQQRHHRPHRRRRHRRVAQPAEHGDRGVPLLPVAKAASSKAAADRRRARRGPRAKDTRARLVERFKDGVYVYPAALFKLAQAEIDDARESAARRYGPSRSWGSDDDPTDGLDEAMEGGEGAEDDEAALGQGQDFESAGASATAAGG